MVGKVINPETGQGFRFIDLRGTRSGRLVFVEHLGRNAHKQQIWRAICDCGKETVLTSPKTRSCGCLRSETAAATQRAKALPPEVKADRIRLNRIRQRARRKADPVVAMQARLSRLFRHALAQVKAIKTSGTFEALGYTVEQFVTHIERQFSNGMGWNNMSEWQIDHIVPTSKAKTTEDVISLNQLSNLRPMWASENNRKKDKQTHLL